MNHQLLQPARTAGRQGPASVEQQLRVELRGLFDVAMGVLSISQLMPTWLALAYALDRSNPGQRFIRQLEERIGRLSEARRAKGRL